MTHAELLQALHWRYATKRFDPDRKISPEVWAALEEALVLTPSSFGFQPWKFLVINDPALRARLQPACWNQAQVTECSHLLVCLAQQDATREDIDRYLTRVAEVRQQPMEALQGFRKMLEGTLLEGGAFADRIPEWAAHQVYIALGSFMTAAALLGIDTCPMEGFVPDQVNAILGLQDSRWRAVVLCPAGYRASGDKYAELPKVRYPLSDVLEHR